MLFETENKYTQQLKHTDLQTAYKDYVNKRAKDFFSALIEEKKINIDSDKITAAIIEEIKKCF